MDTDMRRRPPYGLASGEQLAGDVGELALGGAGAVAEELEAEPPGGGGVQLGKGARTTAAYRTG
jgi:hypothetical protein